MAKVANKRPLENINNDIFRDIEDIMTARRIEWGTLITSSDSLRSEVQAKVQSLGQLGFVRSLMDEAAPVLGMILLEELEKYKS